MSKSITIRKPAEPTSLTPAEQELAIRITTLAPVTPGYGQHRIESTYVNRKLTQLDRDSRSSAKMAHHKSSIQSVVLSVNGKDCQPVTIIGIKDSRSVLVRLTDGRVWSVRFSHLWDRIGTNGLPVGHRWEHNFMAAMIYAADTLPQEETVAQ